MSNCYRGVRASLRSFRSAFKPDMLAYLALTSKSERELCGALAWKLQRFFEQYAPQTLVSREWGYPGTWKTCDIAIISDGDPEVLIEAKAAYIFNLLESDQNHPPYPAKEVRDDVLKLRETEFDCERYILVFITYPKRRPNRRFSSVVKYINDIGANRITEDDLEAGFNRFHSAIGNLPILDNGRIRAGSAFGVDVDVLYWLFNAK